MNVLMIIKIVTIKAGHLSVFPNREEPVSFCTLRNLY